MQKSPEKQNYSAAPRADAAAPAVTLQVPSDCAGMRLDQALARLMPEHSRSRLAQWVRDERVIVDGRAAIPRAKVWGGEALEVRPALDARELGDLPQDIPLEVVYEDDALIVIDKPAGLVVHPGSGNPDGTLLNALLRH
jgi:23S rRNA pseudouridine1911/1915/1917 synthase